MDRNPLRMLTAALLLALAGWSLVACEGYDARKDAYLAKGKELFEAGDDARAQLELKNALQIDNQLAEAWYLLGRIEERAGEFQKAFSNYLRAVELAPDLIEARVYKAKIQVAGNDLEGAEEEIKQVLERASDNTEILVARAALRKRQGDGAGAEADARAVMAREPANTGAAAMLAAVLVDRKAMDEAADTLRSAIAANPKHAALQLMLGGVYETQGNTDGAIGVLRTLVEQYPEELGYRERLTNYYLARGRNDEAEAVLREALAAAPDELKRQRALLMFLVRARGVETAQAELAVMQQRQPDALALRFMQAELLLAAKDNKGAEAAYRAIIDKAQGAGPDAIKARTALAQLLMAEKRDAEAATLVQAVLAESASEPDALLLRAALSLRKNQAEPAINDLRLVLRDYPERVQAQRLLGQAHALRQEYALAADALEKAITLAPQQPLAYLQLAEVRVRNGDNEGALVVLERLLAQVPDNADAQQAMARIQLSEQDWEALAQTAERIRADRPEHPQGYYLEGLVLQRQDKHREAVGAFDKALERRPGAVEPLVAVARSQLALGAPQEAERRVRQVLADEPKNLVALNLLGDVYLAARKADQAMEQFEAAARFHPTSPRAYVRLSQVQAALGDPGGARKTLERGVQETERNGFLVLQYAILLQQMGESEAAITAYEEVLARYPDTAVAINNLAMVLATRVGDQAALDRALELAGGLRDSQVPELLDTLGWVHYQRGEYAAALPYLEKAVAGKPEVAVIRYHLGMNYAKLGRVEAAKEHLGAAAASEDFADRAAAQKALSELGGAG